MIHIYDTDAEAIRSRLESGSFLVACLCTERCHKCDDWWGDFDALSTAFSEACFVWLDVDRHPDMVADIPDVTAYPFLLVRTTELRFMQAVDPDREQVRNLLHQHLEDVTEGEKTDSLEPGLYSFLQD